MNITHAYDMIMPSGKENAALDGYCSKHDDRQEFMLAIDTVLAGWIFLSSSIADNVLAVFLANRDSRSVDAAVENVSRREKESLKLLAE
ncbi:hypothetical protein Dvar_52240 [Desulfosarcina variabilis str. Montpellier]|uniref:hypothetical protein n=1 Tax=Desulfosarcina variabilis TaxID=2300 RepID=UPI003AFB446F